MTDRYLIALGSNRRHHLHGRPRGVVRAAIRDLSELGAVAAVSPIICTAPIGPARRHFANAVCILECESGPETLLTDLKRLERLFGRRRGQVWGDRVLDLDIILWSGGVFTSRHLAIPHKAYNTRRFVLEPALAIAAHWRDPVSGRTLRQQTARIKKSPLAAAK
ncbi:MAG: 2-amino-4-hydroxy-6-hydroxymethyldihydropteridine diphosphokinase [Pseudomonadota bacterium]